MEHMQQEAFDAYRKEVEQLWKQVMQRWTMPSRDLNLLEPQLKERIEFMLEEYVRRYPNDPKPFITCTYRSPEEQNALVRRGVSRAKAGQSLHNYSPAYAADVAFRKADGSLDWSIPLFSKWGHMAQELGLEWGGSWKGFFDGPHVQLPMTYKDAKAGDVPELEPLKKEPTFERLPAYDPQTNEYLGDVTIVDGKKVYPVWLKSHP